MNVKVLIIDDNEQELSFVEEALKHSGLEFTTATSNTDVIKTAVEFQPTIIVTDITSPNIRGLNVVKLLKTTPETNHIPIIFFSPSDKREDLILGLHYGCLDYIDRPINTQDFVKVVVSHSAVESMREVLTPLKVKSAEIMKKYDDIHLNP